MLANSSSPRRRRSERVGGYGVDGGSVAELYDGFEMAQTAERAITFHQAFGKLDIGKLGGARGCVDGAKRCEPVRHLHHRHAHQPRAAVFDLAGEGGHGTKRTEIASDIV